MSTTQICRDDSTRRRLVREHRDSHDEQKLDLNGVDYIEVNEKDQTLLSVYLLNAVPDTLTKENIRIEGGQRIRNIQVVDMQLCDPDDPEQTNCMRVRVDQYGDFSTYTLRLVELDSDGHQMDQPLHGFDVRYARLDFSFKAGCLSDFDCVQEDTCPPPILVEPEIDYLAKDYASFRQLILDRLSLIMPDWKERHIPDIGIVLTEILAYIGDYLSYYQDAVATEAYLETARQRISVRRHVRLVDYKMHEGCNARTWLFIETSDDVSLDPQNIYFITGLNNALPFNSNYSGPPLSREGPCVPPLAPTRHLSRRDARPLPTTILSDDNLRTLPDGTYEVFEPVLLPDDPHEQIQLYAAQDQISFYTWDGQECCLPRGATCATLVDAASSDGTQPPSEPNIHIHVGDILIFEEVLGPKTGNPADADPKHRHAVRLTKVEKTQDTLHDPPLPLVEIAWVQEDALPFPLCLSTQGPPPKCIYITDISVARGNVILVDHGKTIADERVIESKDVTSVPALSSIAICEGSGSPSETETTPGVFRPSLQQTPLTFYEPLPANAPLMPVGTQPPGSLTSATRLLLQDPRKALPAIQLTGMSPLDDPGDVMIHDTLTSDYEYADDDSEQDDSQPMSKDEQWTARYDLLESLAQDTDFVVEMDNDRVAHLRFGDGELGEMPEAGTIFNARYRIGNGAAGNVGAGAISHIVFHEISFDPTDIILLPRNPFPASGGVDPESVAEIKLFAPHTFRTDIQRAITADDYAQLAGQYPNVQRAAASLRWTGSWYEVLVAIDQKGTDEIDPALLQGVAAYLEQYRRIGHDLRVVAADFVALDIEMTICVLPNYLRGHVEAALFDLLSNRVLRNGQLGFFHPDNLTFGQSIALSKLIAVVQAVSGVRSVAVTHFKRLFGEHDFVTDGFLPLGPMEIARLDNDRSFPENGKLVLHMEGGR